MVETAAGGQARIDLSAIAENLIPEVHNTYNIGSDTKSWAIIYSVIAVLTSITLGGIYLGATTEGYFFINASTIINGSLNVEGNLSAGNATLESLNVTNDINVIDGEIYVDGEEVATITDLITGNITVTSVVAVRNTAGATAWKGAVMRFTDYNSGSDRYEVKFADNTNASLHGDCLMLSSTANNLNGQCVIYGMIEAVDTDGFTEAAMLYVNETPGTLTEIKPIYANCIQMIAAAMRSHATVGTLRVHGAGRCNDVSSSINITGNISASYYFGDAIFLSNLPAGDNESWNQSLADNLYADISVTGDNESWNESYAGDLYAPLNYGDNWNKTYADTLYAAIQWGYNHTLAVYNLWNTIWSSTYNSTYAGLINNASYLSTFNDTYDSYALNVSINYTLETYNAYDTRWTVTYNETYAGLINNASYLTTFNSTYDSYALNVSINYTLETYNAYDGRWTKTFNASYDAKVSFPGWDGNLAWINETNIFTANQNLTGQNISAIDCINFDSGGKICSGV